MSTITLEEKLHRLAKRFYIYCTFSPTEENIVDVYDIDKYGNSIIKTLRRYRAATLQKAILKAYALELENKLLK